MAIKLSTVINTSAFFCQLLFIYNCSRMTITFNGDAAGMNSFMGLDQGVNIFHVYHALYDIYSPYHKTKNL